MAIEFLYLATKFMCYFHQSTTINLQTAPVCVQVFSAYRYSCVSCVGLV